jgi:hypothetical protein
MTVVLDRTRLPSFEAETMSAHPDRDISVHAISVGKSLLKTEWMQLLADEAATATSAPRGRHLPPNFAIDAYTRMGAGGLRGRFVIIF